MTVNLDKEQFQYMECIGEIPTDIPEGAFISIDRNKALKIYSLGFQPAKSIPEIPRWFLNKYATKDFTIFEPFAGSGTTIIESLKYGTPILWMDNHPLSRLICKVKSSNFNIDDVKTQLITVLENSINQDDVAITTKFRNRDFWFQQPVQEGLQILKNNIYNTPNSVQPLLLLAFASTVRKCSDMDDGMILASRRSGNREIPQFSRTDVFDYFKHYATKAINAVLEWNQVVPNQNELSNEISTHDARDLGDGWECDAIITSPPYINAIDYVWASKFELHWLDLVDSDKHRLNLYSEEIGTERIPSKVYKGLGKTGHRTLDKAIEDIYYARKYKASKGQNELRARVVYKYFEDMKIHFQQSFKHLRPGGYYCFAIGDVSTICGVDIPVASVLVDIAEEVGFENIFHFNILLKNRKLNIPRNVNFAGTIEHDTTIVLQKPL